MPRAFEIGLWWPWMWLYPRRGMQVHDFCILAAHAAPPTRIEPWPRPTTARCSCMYMIVFGAVHNEKKIKLMTHEQHARASEPWPLTSNAPAPVTIARATYQQMLPHRPVATAMPGHTSSEDAYCKMHLLCNAFSMISAGAMNSEFRPPQIKMGPNKLTDQSTHSHNTHTTNGKTRGIIHSLPFLGCAVLVNAHFDRPDLDHAVTLQSTLQ